MRRCRRALLLAAVAGCALIAAAGAARAQEGQPPDSADQLPPGILTPAEEHLPVSAKA